MTKEIYKEMYPIVNAIEYFWRIEEDKAVKQELYEVIQKLDVILEMEHAPV